MDTDCVDENWQYAIEVAAGTCKVRVRAAGHPEQWYSERRTWDRAWPVEVAEWDRYLDLYLRAGFADIAGRITDASGAPVENADVYASVSENVRGCASVDGWFTVTGVPAGTYDVEVAPEGTHWPTTTSVTVELVDCG